MNENVDKKHLRIEILIGLTVFFCLGILDYIMLPIHYQQAWYARIFLGTPFAVVVFVLTFIKSAERLLLPLKFIMIICAQISLFYMIIIADPLEPAFYGYYVGTILILLACEFMFQMDMKPTVLLFIISILMFLSIAFLQQDLFSNEAKNYNRNWLIGNFVFFLSIGFISLLGLHKLQKSRNAEREANLLKTAFLANISHEIRTPLNGLTGCAKLMSLPENDDLDRQKYEKVMSTCSGQLLEIVDSILTMASIETGRTELNYSEISIESFIYELTEHFKIQAKDKNLDFTIENLVLEEQDRIITEPTKLRIILNNLLSNAMKFTDKGGIVLRVGFLSKQLRISVEDTGIGFEKEDTSKIFNSFFQVHSGYSRNYGGNGLGLSICKSYTKMLGGKIEAESYPGKGSIFVVTIPVKLII